MRQSSCPNQAQTHLVAVADLPVIPIKAVTGPARRAIVPAEVGVTPLLQKESNSTTNLPALPLGLALLEGIMKRFSKDKKIDGIVRYLIRSGWTVRPGKKHASILSPAGKRIAIPSTPSDFRSWRNFSRDIQRMDNNQRSINA